MRRVVILIGLVTICAGCGGSSSGGTTPSGSTSSASTGSVSETAALAVEQTWTKFFDYQTSTADRQALLEDGASLGRAMAIGDKLAKQQKLEETVDVKTITTADATHASVTYDILSHGTVLLPDANGVAIQVDGKWLVSKQSFCGLIELGAGGKTIPGCSVAG
jgi:hypothetical protein